MADITEEQWNYLNNILKDKDSGIKDSLSSFEAHPALFALTGFMPKDADYELGRLLNSDTAKTLSDTSGIPIDELNIEDIEAARPWYSPFSNFIDNIISNRLIQGDRIGENYAKAFKHKYGDSNLDEATLAAIINASSGFRNSILDLIPEKDKRGFFSYLHNLGASTINKISGDEAAILGHYRKYLKEHKPSSTGSIEEILRKSKEYLKKQPPAEVSATVDDSRINSTLPSYVQTANNPVADDKFEIRKAMDERLLENEDRARAFSDRWDKQTNHAAWWLYK